MTDYPNSYNESPEIIVNYQIIARGRGITYSRSCFKFTSASEFAVYPSSFTGQLECLRFDLAGEGLLPDSENF